MKRKTSHIILISLLSTFALSAAVTSSLAWFKTGNDVNFGTGESGHITATTNGGYFGALPNGAGTYGFSSTNPFVISTPTHLYNLAWLQFIGAFNDETCKAYFGDEGDGILQCYFTVANDIDMSGMILPPIGTELYPFFSYFNGGGYTISNLTMTNDLAVSDGGVTTVGTSFANQVAKPSESILNGLPSTAIPRVVGFFGVIGDIHTINTSIAPSDYNSFTPSMINVTIENITVQSKTDQTLIGLAAGYVDGDMSGVKVDGNSTLDLGKTAKSAISNTITSNLSDYSLVGYSKQTGQSGTFAQEVSNFYDSGTAGEAPGWGGSIDMLSLNLRIYTDLQKGTKDGTAGSGNNRYGYYSYTDTSNRMFIEPNSQNYFDPEATDKTYNLGYKQTGSGSSATYDYTILPLSVYLDTDFTNAPTYNPESTYELHDLVKYDSNYYRCTSKIEIPETWTLSHWTQVQKYETKPSNTGFIVGGNAYNQSSPNGESGGAIKTASSSISGKLKNSTNSSAYSSTSFVVLTNANASRQYNTVGSNSPQDFALIEDTNSNVGYPSNTSPRSSLPTGTSNSTTNRTYSKRVTSSSLARYESSRAKLHNALNGKTYVQGLRFNSSATLTASNYTTTPSANQFKTPNS